MSFGMARLRIVDPQGRAVVGDEYGEQTRGLLRTCVFAHEMLAAGRLEEGFAGAVNPRWTGRGVLRSYRARYDESHDAARAVMLWGLASGFILHEERGERLSGNVWKLLRHDDV